MLVFSAAWPLLDAHQVLVKAQPRHVGEDPT